MIAKTHLKVILSVIVFQRAATIGPKTTQKYRLHFIDKKPPTISKTYLENPAQIPRFVPAIEAQTPIFPCAIFL